MDQSNLKIFERTLRTHRTLLRKYRFLIIAIDISIYFFGLKKTNRILDFFITFLKKNNIPDVADEIGYLDICVSMFDRIKTIDTLKGKCLSQSLAMQFLLRQKAINTDLVMGGYIKDGALFAHAWLEKDGEILNDHPFVISQYKILFSGKAFNVN